MKQTSRKKMLVSSVAMMMVATVSLGSATFAWFSQNTKATASGITAQTSQSSNIVLSETGAAGSWTDRLTFANYATGVMNPVTTADFTEWVTTKADTKNAGIKGASATYEDAVANTDYTATKLYMKYESADTNATKNVKVDLNVTNTAGTENFLRVALVPVDATTKGIQATNIVYGTAADDFALSRDSFTALNADNTGKTITTTTSKALISNATLKANTEYQFDVYVWYEGTDPQCLDSNAVNNLGISFDVSEVRS